MAPPCILIKDERDLVVFTVWYTIVALPGILLLCVCLAIARLVKREEISEIEVNDDPPRGV